MWGLRKFHEPSEKCREISEKFREAKNNVRYFARPCAGHQTAKKAPPLGKSPRSLRPPPPLDPCLLTRGVPISYFCPGYSYFGLFVPLPSL